MKIRQFFLTFLILSVLQQLQAQEYSCFTFPCRHDDKILEHPFSGGLNSPQFNQADIDLDGVEDLIIFDRITNDIQVFLYREGTYKFECTYDDLFPYVSSWMIMSDYDHDGIKDLFISPPLSSSPSIEVYKGHVKNGLLSFEKLNFPYGSGEVVSYKYFGFYYGAYVAKPDIPAITDVDNDGDLDILSFESGGGTVNYYRNLCVEDGLSLDSFKIELADRCWGKFKESIFGDEILLSDDSLKCAESPGFRHAGSTILPIDMDGDLDTDLLLGDSEYNGLIYIHNGGINNDFATELEKGFPEDDLPVQLHWFLGSFLADIDMDGQQELIVAPNSILGGQNVENVLIYKDIDPGNNFKFSYESNHFLLDDMIDWGGKVFPKFVDENQDGLIDLIIGMSGMIGNDTILDTRLIYYQNEGTTEKPAFFLFNDDYLNFTEKEETFLAPEFGDLDGDNDTDLLIGLENGTMMYFENSAGPGKPFQFENPVMDFMSIDVGENALLSMYDINTDGLTDIIAGNARSFTNQNKTGSLALFKNKGQENNPDFDSDWNSIHNEIPFGNIQLQETAFNTRSWAITSFYDSKEDRGFITGSILGSLNRYMINDLTEPVLVQEKISDFDFGRFSAPTIADIDNDGYFDLLTGLETGGFRLFHTDIPTRTSSDKRLSSEESIFVIYPNPASDVLKIIQNYSGESIEKLPEVELFDQYGNLHFKIYSYRLGDEIDVSGLPQAIYYIRLKSDKIRTIKKFSKL